MKAIQLLDTSQSKGDGANFEDIGNQVGRFAWVLDGATALIKKEGNPYTPQWLVQEADKVLAKGAETAQSLQELIDFYLENFNIPADLHGLDRLENPNFAMAIIHASEGFLEYAALADCYIVVNQGNNITTYTEPHWEKITQDIGKKAFFIEKSEAERLQVYRDIRLTSNLADGYWIGTAKGEGLRHLDIRRMPVAADTQVVLCTDGFERAVSLFGLYDWAGVFATNLDQITDELRQAETRYLDKTEYPREKLSDDVYALKLAL